MLNGPFVQGYNAFVYGMPVSLNPYYDGLARDLWFDGWNKAQKYYTRDDCL